MPVPPEHHRQLTVDPAHRFSFALSAVQLHDFIYIITVHGKAQSVQCGRALQSSCHVHHAAWASTAGHW